MLTAAFAALAVMTMATSVLANAKVCSTAGTGVACQAGHGKVYKGKIVATLTSGTSGTLLWTGSGASGNMKCGSSTYEGEVMNGKLVPA